MVRSQSNVCVSIMQLVSRAIAPVSTKFDDSLRGFTIVVAVCVVVVVVVS